MVVNITVDSTLGKGTEFSVICPATEKIYRDTLTAIHDGLTSQSLINQFAQRDWRTCPRLF
jgi:hypothetical protein